MSKFLTAPAFIVSLFAAVLILHILALIFGWYLTFGSFDNFYHFLGGFGVGAVFFYFFQKNRQIFDVFAKPLVTLILALGFAALAGVAWEFFEFSFDYFFASFGLPPAQLGPRDTMADLFFDLLGGASLSFLYLKFRDKTCKK